MAGIKFGVTIDAAPEMLERSDYGAVREIALHSESLGYHSLWVMDHLTWGEGCRGAVFEAWTLLSALSTETERIGLGTMVACNSYRNPALTAKIAATLDVISGGRLLFGYGAGWKRDEYQAYGYRFPKPSVRVKQMRKAIILIKELWTEEIADFHGDFYRVNDAPCNPKPLQKPHPPIIIGGGGERYTLRVAAELGDGWNIWGASPEDYKRKARILTKYCDEAGRRIEDLELSWSGNMILAEDEKKLRRKIERYGTRSGIISTYEDCAGKLQEYIDLGCSHFIFSMRTFNEEKKDFIEKIASSF